ncbi:pyrroline-5-carboxylate reductase [Salinicoccus roseus]|uniref:pyrroline-5-carboxylate reductase n=1 Tax=Salinicoccus roseus TaxID=45670 RepID=UPI000F5074F4|nr:pyrroline-5-carboxylate reductase [Salinicoccus roseus]MBY8909366.1 pyrroline-5-carboxylate reductase [Salinicoccus roseus]RPE51054.1 pyrroline-5-carboxylate reductase [Salinicoccus roseus]GGA78375.1 pyrroline-5-carboxylate reductase [Salinicoccus roseus]
MSYRIGFIGAGKMVNHIVKGLLKSPEMKDDIIVTGRNQQKLDKFNEGKGIEVSTDYSLLSECDIIVNGVSSDQTLHVFNEVRAYTREDAIHISIAAGVSIDEMETILPQHKIVRNMPNIAVSVQEGVMVMAANAHISDEDKETLDEIFNRIAAVAWVEEPLMKYAPSLTGSSPTYTFLMIEAMADKAVSAGFPRQQAYMLAAQAVVGAGKLVLETESHPAVLKDQITTSGGSTIQGVMELENNGFRKSVIQAMEAINNANKK